MRALIVLLALSAGGCSNLAEIGQAPAMSPVGDGVHLVSSPMPGSAPPRTRRSYQSVWDETGGDIFGDPRAKRPGDVLTVAISIDEKAKLDNKTGRSRDSKTAFGLDYLVDVGGTNTAGTGNANINSKSSTQGEGKIDRAEEIKLSVAVVVTDVLPNGNLMISGSQEVRVNQEMRVLQVAGLVRPRDISRLNVISYEKIAEARISYGGRGRLMEVQQPAWGHQIYDAVVPF